MPLLMPKVSGVNFQTNASGTVGTTEGTALTSDGVAHTLPTAYTEIISATTYDTYWVEIILHGNYVSNTNTDSLVNIYIGADSSEQLLIPNLLAGWTATFTVSTVPKIYAFPLHIPAGSRLSGKHQSVRTATAVYCIIRLFGGAGYSHWYGTGVECVGAVTGSSRGTSVTPAVSPEGTLTSIGTNTYEWGYMMPMLGGNVADTSMTADALAVDIASGSATSTLIEGLGDFLFQCNATEYAMNVGQGGRFCRIPSSTTLYLRALAVGSTEAKDFCIYGVY